MTNNLPRELQPLASLLALSPVRPKYRDAHPPEVQQALQFPLATPMHEVGRFGLLNVAEVDDRWHHTFSGAGEMFSTLRPEMSKEIERKLDAAYFHLYGIVRHDVDYIMDTFPMVKRKDEAAQGEYRTKRVILEIYDAMQQAIETGQPYQTLLDPPPADSQVGHLQRKPKMKEARQGLGKMRITCMSGWAMRSSDAERVDTPNGDCPVYPGYNPDDPIQDIEGAAA